MTFSAFLDLITLIDLITGVSLGVKRKVKCFWILKKNNKYIFFNTVQFLANYKSITNLLAYLLSEKWLLRVCSGLDWCLWSAGEETSNWQSRLRSQHNVSVDPCCTCYLCSSPRPGLAPGPAVVSLSRALHRKCLNPLTPTAAILVQL